ncbi:MAG: PIG-L family deacetylase, partial [SAR202 cluster bacterium]|nr:PIG-L family deacetylase [SAR202 cluster bacterium]
MVDSNKTVLVVTPHPDDAEGGAGGTIVKWANEGNNIVLVVCTNGDKGTSDTSLSSEKLAKMREEEQLNAAKELGVSEVVFLREPDQGLEDNDRFREKLVRQIRKHKPEVV